MKPIVRSKICGITRLQDALDASRLGADALGFVFYDKSPRAIELAGFVEIAKQLPPFISKVGLFVNPEPSMVHEVLATGFIDVLQFHGDEPSDFCEQFAKPYMKAVRVQSAEQINAAAQEFATASALLLDAYDVDLYGGTGKQFDWALLGTVNNDIDMPIVVAGGLNATNVSQLISQVSPYAVDISGGVEQELNGKPIKGVKCAAQMGAFLREVKGV